MLQGVFDDVSGCGGCVFVGVEGEAAHEHCYYAGKLAGKPLPPQYAIFIKNPPQLQILYGCQQRVR